MLLGRKAECVAVATKIDEARNGRGGALIVGGRAGIGKTALLSSCLDSSEGVTARWVTSASTETDMPYAILQRLLSPFEGEAWTSPFSAADADPRAAGAAALEALRIATQASGPIVIAIDGADRLDKPSLRALGVLCRRLEGSSVAVLLTMRAEQVPPELDGLEEIRLGGLPAPACLRLLEDRARPIADTPARTLVAASGGNPLALLEFASELSPAQLSGAARLPDPLRLATSLEAHYLAQIEDLGSASRSFLLLAAAAEGEEGDVLWKAAERSGLARDTIETPRVERLVSTALTVSFFDPLMRAALYHAAPAPERRRAHLVLSKAIGPSVGGRSLLHLAAATRGADEAVAIQLMSAAERAHTRGDWAGRTEFLEWAADLSGDPQSRARRRLAAAQGRFSCGDPAAALATVEQVSPFLADPRDVAEAARLEAAIRFVVGEFGEAPYALVRAARDLAALDPKMGRESMLAAFDLSFFAGTGTDHVLRSLRTEILGKDSGPTVVDDLLEGFAKLQLDDDLAGMRTLNVALATLAASDTVSLRACAVASVAAVEVLDERAWESFIERWVRGVRAEGLAAPLPFALVRSALCETALGRFGRAEKEIAECEDAAAETDGATFFVRYAPRAGTLVSAWRGQEKKTREAAAAALDSADGLGAGRAVQLVYQALAILELGLGRHEAALAAACRARGASRFTSCEILPDLIEAAARGGDRGLASTCLEELEARVALTDTDWGQGILHRSRALLATEEEAEEDYRQAIIHLGRTSLLPQLGRAHLLYGEWLRRRRRRRDSREQLREAVRVFEAMGAQAFARRARSELLASGERLTPAAEAEAGLTPREREIAVLASQGASNAEIAGGLFISPNTVRYHLQKVFRKLGVTRRSLLREALERQPASEPPPREDVPDLGRREAS
jgi:DNA-binding CsgD family transcriptional regulator